MTSYYIGQSVTTYCDNCGEKMRSKITRANGYYRTHHLKCEVRND
jgi:hypothetical protein